MIEEKELDGREPRRDDRGAPRRPGAPRRDGRRRRRPLARPDAAGRLADLLFEAERPAPREVPAAAAPPLRRHRRRRHERPRGDPAPLDPARDLRLRPRRARRTPTRLDEARRADRATATTRRTSRDADLVVISSAVAESNPEVAAARERGIPVIRRAEMLGEIMRLKQGIAVAGTHGKTTTTSLTGMVLTEAGFDPTIVVGGQVRILGHERAAGQGRLPRRRGRRVRPVVPGADAGRRRHHQRRGGPPRHATATSPTSSTRSRRSPTAFRSTARSSPASTTPACASSCPRIKRRVVTYGESPEAQPAAREHPARGVRHDLRRLGRGDGAARRGAPAAPGPPQRRQRARGDRRRAASCSIPFPTIARALAEFTGVVRRFETKGERGGVLVVDDYAHHPTEIARDARGRAPGLSRTAASSRSSSRTSSPARATSRTSSARRSPRRDVAIVTDVYPSREKPIPGVTGELVAEAARRAGHAERHLCP